MENGSVCINGSCGGVISQTVIAGTSLNVSVVPDSGYQFYAWSSDFLVVLLLFQF